MVGFPAPPQVTCPCYLSLGTGPFATHSLQCPDLGLGPQVRPLGACRLRILIVGWGWHQAEEELCPLAFGASCPCFMQSLSPHTQFSLCWSRSCGPVFQVVSFQRVTGMCAQAKENIKMFWECFRKIAWSRLPSLAYVALFLSPLLCACVICNPELSAVQLWLFLPQPFFLTAKRIQFSTNNAEQ